MLRVLSKLRSDYQSVLTLRFISGLSPEETAQVMKRSVGAIRVLQHRALAVLRQEIDKTGHNEN
jgi:RNA polymerase sigma-70 factor (ECF subfamily)